MRSLLERLDTGTWSAGVIGLGYIGLPLAVAIAKSGNQVSGFDDDPTVIEGLAAGRPHIEDITETELRDVESRLSFSSEPKVLEACDVVFICVPTPLSTGKQPDMSHIERATDTVSRILRSGQLIVLESTTYPGTTQDVLLPKLLESGLALDVDFCLAYSPERVDPGNSLFTTTKIPRIVGGVSKVSAEAAVKAYRQIVASVIEVSSARVAETAKLLENTFRWVNIALANEMSFISRALGVDVIEVIDAAATKPFGFMPFYPGPGVGGHCIPLDPFFLQYAARSSGEGTRFIELAEAVNMRMPLVVVDRIAETLNAHEKPLKGSSVLLVGVAYKPNVGDHRQSPALDVIRELLRRGAQVNYMDPFVAEIHEIEFSLRAIDPSDEDMRGTDCVVILCDHDSIDFQRIAQLADCIFDARNALRRRGITGPQIVSL